MEEFKDVLAAAKYFISDTIASFDDSICGDFSFIDGIKITQRDNDYDVNYILPLLDSDMALYVDGYMSKNSVSFLLCEYSYDNQGEPMITSEYSRIYQIIDEGIDLAEKFTSYYFPKDSAPIPTTDSSYEIESTKTMIFTSGEEDLIHNFGNIYYPVAKTLTR